MNQTKNRNDLLKALKFVGPSDINSTEEFELIKKLTDLLSQKEVKRRKKRKNAPEQEPELSLR